MCKSCNFKYIFLNHYFVIFPKCNKSNVNLSIVRTKKRKIIFISDSSLYSWGSIEFKVTFWDACQLYDKLLKSNYGLYLKATYVILSWKKDINFTRSHETGTENLIPRQQKRTSCDVAILWQLKLL